MTKLFALAGIVLASILTFLVLIGSNQNQTITPTPSTSTSQVSTVCSEDMPCWNCHTMGNHQCGPQKAIPTGMQSDGTCIHCGPGDNVCKAPGDCGYGDNPEGCPKCYTQAAHSLTAMTSPTGERLALESFNDTDMTSSFGYITAQTMNLPGVIDQCQVTPSEPQSGTGTLVGATCRVIGPHSIRVRVFEISPKGLTVVVNRKQVTVMVLATHHIY